VQSQQIVSAQLLDNGPVWLGLLLDSVQTVLGLQPDHSALKALGVKVGAVAVEDAVEPAPALIARSNREARAFVHTDAPSVEVRAFAAPVGIAEDPVTGSLNASLAQWLMADGYAPTTYTASQGTCLGRAGRVRVHRDAAGQVWVGGDTVTCITGTVQL
jgi:PhzF family phenazine biosynthesis protein